MEAAAEIYGYASEMAARERADPSDNLSGDLLKAEVNGGTTWSRLSPVDEHHGRSPCFNGRSVRTS